MSKTNDRSVIMEKLLLVGHLAHTEIHLGELIERTSLEDVRKILLEEIDIVRKERTKTLRECGHNIEVLWCSIKHFLLAYIHCHEIAAKELADGNRVVSLQYYDRAKTLMLSMDILLGSSIINRDTVATCPRCEEK